MCGIQNCHVYQIESRSCMHLSLSYAMCIHIWNASDTISKTKTTTERCSLNVYASLFHSIQNSGLFLHAFFSLSCILKRVNFTAANLFFFFCSNDKICLSIDMHCTESVDLTLFFPNDNWKKKMLMQIANALVVC